MDEELKQVYGVHRVEDAEYVPTTLDKVYGKPSLANFIERGASIIEVGFLRICLDEILLNQWGSDRLSEEKLFEIACQLFALGKKMGSLPTPERNKLYHEIIEGSPEYNRTRPELDAYALIHAYMVENPATELGGWFRATSGKEIV